MKLTLSPREARIINRALEVAREEYMAHAGQCVGVPRVADCFKAQAAECSEMLAKLETVADLEGLVLA